MTEQKLLDLINDPEELLSTGFKEKLKAGYRVAQRRGEMLTTGLSNMGYEINTTFDNDNYIVNYEIRLVDTVNKQ